MSDLAIAILQCLRHTCVTVASTLALSEPAHQGCDSAWLWTVWAFLHYVLSPGAQPKVQNRQIPCSTIYSTKLETGPV